LPCRINPPGAPAAVLGADGSRGLGELLVELANRAGASGDRDYYIAVLVTTPRGLVDASLLTRGLRVAAACASVGGSEERGDAALDLLRRVAGEPPSWGLLEAYDLGPSGGEEFLKVYGDARVGREASLYWVAGFEDSGDEEEGGEAGPGGAGETRIVVEAFEDPELFMARVALASRLVKYTRARDPESLHREARELSRANPGKLYRLAVALTTDETLNVFYLNGRPCLMIRMADDYSRASAAGGDVIEVLGDIDKSMVEYVSISEVECPDCVERVSKACLRIPERRERPSQPEKPQAPREAASNEKREPVWRRWLFWRTRQ